MVVDATLIVLLAINVEVLVFRFAVNDGEKPQEDVGLRTRWMGGVGQRTYQSAIRLVSTFVGRPKFGAGKLMFFIVKRRHGGYDHLTLQASKAPCLSSKLHNPLNSNLDTFFFSGIRKVLDSVDNLFHYSACSSIDSLLRSTAGKCSK
jgi:hypothetical protein